jgi:hypothetical protein
MPRERDSNQANRVVPAFIAATARTRSAWAIT